MHRSVNRILCVLSAVSGLAVPAFAQAQGDPESGDVQGGASGGAQMGVAAGAQPEGSWQPPTGQVPPQDPGVAPAPGEPYADPSLAPQGADPMAGDAAAAVDSDHGRVVGTFGVGFFGVLAVPVMGCDVVAPLCTAALGNSTVSAPTIGLRYWLSDALGVEAALGLNVTSGEAGGLSTSAFGAAVHGGVPLALAHSGHFAFEVVPQLNFGIASGSYEVVGTTSDVSGLLIEIGAKAGAEIHFGFIDIPQLSLQGSVGLMVRHESRKVETVSGTLPVVTLEQSQTFFGTGVDGEPWDIFTGSIAALYYF